MILVALAVALPLMLAGPDALAAKKKKKKPKPYKSQEVTIMVAHPVAWGYTGAVNSLTAKEFEATCATPRSNGVDAYIFEVPKAYRTITAMASAIGHGATVTYDLDMYLYNKDCQPTFALNAEGTDEVGMIPPGTAWILVHNYVGDPGLKAHLELKA